LQGILTQGTVHNEGSTITRPGQAPAPVGGQPEQFKPIEQAVVPNLAAAYRLTDQVVVGLSVTSPFDFTTKYDYNSFARYDALKSKLETIDIGPTIAWQPLKWLAVGVGFDAQHVDANIGMALPNLSASQADAGEVLKGNGWNYGYNVGVQLHPDDRLSIGVSYRSAVTHDLNGSINVAGLQGLLAFDNGDPRAKAKFTTPWFGTVGARYKVTPQFTVNLQVQRVGWSEFSTIAVTPAATSTVGAMSIAEGYRDTTTAAVGLEYAINPQWTVRTGAQYDPTPTNPANRSAGVPDGNRWLVTAGTTVKPRSWLALDFAIAWIDFEGSQIDRNATAYAGTIAVTPISIQGEVDASGAVVSAGAHLFF
jgi:long-chain fatty acid transport protein